MDALLSGNRTSLIQFTDIKPNGLSEAVAINAKLSLQKNGNSYDLKMHPVNLLPKNDLELSQKEMEFLKKDPLNLLPKMVVGNNGKLVDSLISFDRVTNEFLAVKRNKIRSPEAINDIFLNDAQKKDFANGKPIQLGNESYQMDVNSENGVDGKNIKKIKFQTGKYSGYHFLLDAALVVSGLSILVMIEHLAKMAFNNREAVHGLLSQDLKPAIKRTVSNIVEKANNGIQLSNREKNELLVINVKDTLIEEQQQNRTRPQKQKPPEEPLLDLSGTKPLAQQTTDLSQAQKMKKVKQPSFTYFGKLLEHGPAPYEFNRENRDNYFVRLGTDAGEKLIWGVDLERTISQGGINLGEQIGINHEGVKPVRVNVDVKDDKGIVIGTQEKTIDRNNWEIRVLESKNNIAIKNEIRTMPFEAPKEKREQGKQASKIEQLKTHIAQEVYKKNSAAVISTNDEIKITHPEQRQVGETKPVLEKDKNKQGNSTATSTDTIKKDIKEIQQVRKEPKR